MRAVETTPAASPNVGEEVTLVGHAQGKIIQPPSLEKTSELGRIIFISQLVDPGYANSRGPLVLLPLFGSAGRDVD